MATGMALVLASGMTKLPFYSPRTVRPNDSVTREAPHSGWCGSLTGESRCLVPRTRCREARIRSRVAPVKFLPAHCASRLMVPRGSRASSQLVAVHRLLHAATRPCETACRSDVLRALSPGGLAHVGCSRRSDVVAAGAAMYGSAE